jgi:hypothetical protein
MSKTCTGCGEPTTDHITITRLRLRLPHHRKCALEAERELLAIRGGITDALAARLQADGALPRVDEL